MLALNPSYQIMIPIAAHKSLAAMALAVTFKKANIRRFNMFILLLIFRYQYSSTLFLSKYSQTYRYRGVLYCSARKLEVLRIDIINYTALSATSLIILLSQLQYTEWDSVRNDNQC